MVHGHFQRLDQSQRQILAPILQQNIQILLLNTVDLLQEIQKKLDDNPFLEVESEGTRSLEVENLIADRIQWEEAQNIPEDDFENYKQNIYEETSRYEFNKKPYSSSDKNTKQSFLENTITTQESLYDYLKQQLKMLDLRADEMEIGDVIISCIDENGILRTPLEEIARYTRSDMDLVEGVLKKVQELDPAGVGARNSQEFILLQVEKLYGRKSLTYQVAEKYFEVFESLEPESFLPHKAKKSELEKIQYNAEKLKKKAIREVARLLNFKAPEVEEHMKIIEENITPGPAVDQVVENEFFSYIIPDILVSVNPEDYSIDIKIFDDYLPKLKLNEEYRKFLRKERGKEQGENIQELKNKYEEAKSFVNLIKRRSSSLYNLTIHLVEIQKDFFLKGSEHIKPLTIKEMGEILGVHESTVSRIVNNKYVSTPYGVYPLKYLFSHHIGGNRHDVSAKRVGELIKKIIVSEGGNKKLSDSSIERILKNMGIKISRRTVAKYRKKLNIRSSFDR